MKKYQKSILTIMFIGFMFVACKKDDTNPNNPGDSNESELITTVKLVFVDSAGVLPEQTFEWRDLDGEGGNSAQIDTIKLQAQKTFNVSILLLDESKSPIDTISNEVFEEGVDHMFFFSHSTVNISTNILDFDANGLGIGLQSKWVTTSTSVGTSNIILKHQPGVKDGTQTPGETDIDVLFPSRVQ